MRGFSSLLLFQSNTEKGAHTLYTNLTVTAETVHFNLVALIKLLN